MENTIKPFVPRQCLPRTSQLLGSMIGESTIRVARHYLKEMLPPIGPGAVIHDNGCGTGAVTRAVLETYPELLTGSASTKTTIHATDINPAFVQDFRAYADAQQGWSDLVQTAAMPAEDLSAFAPETFTHSFTNFVIFGARDPRKAAAEAYRTLKPGGVAVMTTWATLPHSAALDRTRAQLYDGEQGKLHIQTEWHRGSHLVELLRGAGFGRVDEAAQVESGMEHESLDVWTRLAWSWMGTPAGGWTERDEEAWDENRALFGRHCLEQGFEELDDGSGRVWAKMVANVVIAWKD